MLVFVTMALIGWVLGFIGAGGSGLIIAVLTLVFAVPIETAFGTSLAAMVFTTISGAYSHFTEGNIVLKVGISIGLFGVLGAFSGTRIAEILPVHDLKWLTAAALFVSACILSLRLFITKSDHSENRRDQLAATSLVTRRYWFYTALIGLPTGLLSGTFGIGSTPLIQIGLLVLIGLRLRQAVGTTMLVILPIALAGGVGYYSIGHLDFRLLAEVVLGTTLGSFIGAKFTKLVSPIFLKSAMVIVPIVSALILLV